MAIVKKTVLDFAAITSPVSTDILYLLRGTTNRDKKITYGNLVKDAPVSTVEQAALDLKQDINAELTSLKNQVTLGFLKRVGAGSYTATALAISDTVGLQTALNAKVTANSAITGASKAKITYDAKGLITAGANLVASDIPTLTASKISDFSVTALGMSVTGMSLSAVAINGLDSLIAAIGKAQGQINVRQASDARLTALASLNSTTGLMVQTGASAFTKRSLASANAAIVITDPTGVAANPSVNHATSDGYHHVPATSTTHNGKVLASGVTAGSEAWTQLYSTHLANFDSGVRSVSVTGLAITGSAIAATDSILTAIGKAQGQINAKLPLTGGTMTGDILIASLTASTILATGASKQLVSLPVATYPSLAELAFVKGLTSAVQTQISAKLPLTGGTMTGDILLHGGRTFGSDTADGSDDSYNVFAGGLSADPARGAYLSVRGNERAVTGGKATVAGGSGVDGSVELVAGPTGTIGTINLYTGDVLREQITKAGLHTIASLTASEILATGASKELVSLPVATYPSLAELAFVKGLTSAVQTQISAKLPLTGGTMAGWINAPALGINAGTADGSDDSYVVLNGGGSSISDGRGGSVLAYGNEQASRGGSIYTTAGNSAIEGDLVYRTGGSVARMRITKAGGIVITLPTLQTLNAYVVSATEISFNTLLTGETFGRTAIYPGKIEFGSGAGVRDVNLYRSAANTLKTDGSLTVAGDITSLVVVKAPRFATTVQSTALTSGTITWDLASGEMLDITNALTGNVTINITNPIAGGESVLTLTQPASVKTITLSLANVVFRQTGTYYDSTDIAVINNIGSSSCFYKVTLTWATASLCYVSVS